LSRERRKKTPAGARLGDRKVDRMTVDEEEAPADETPDEGSAPEADDDEDEIEAHGGWGGVGRPDS
jgi:hypothetical protein